LTASFGDNVRICDVQLTKELGFAGLRGVVYGMTTPSITGIEIIGPSGVDYAINVHFEDRKESFWFASELVEIVDHAAGSEITLDGVNKKWIRQSDSSWEEISTSRPWWKFWKN
jgi:hypothetical protein